ncbi:MAG: hypothetical protein RSC29_04370, partial [Oscillospiraceae bacterium]
MTTKFKKLFENKKSASYYFKITVTYSLLLAISLVAFSSFIMVVFLYQSEKLITDSNSQMLNQLNNFTDKYLLERINSLCAEYFSEDSSYPEINSFS